ncbi:unnamed protein product [Ixodes pacificus]
MTSWELFQTSIARDYLYPENSTLVDKLLHEMATLPIVHVGETGWVVRAALGPVALPFEAEVVGDGESWDRLGSQYLPSPRGDCEV